MNGLPSNDFGDYVKAAAERGELVVQPRMGMADPADMAAGLRAVGAASARTAGTITLDSYTRVGDHDAARAALHEGSDLNGFPIVAHGPVVTARVAAAAGAMPVQVRHGSARPEAIFATLVDAGLSATEGGPVSYCLPYGRTPLAESVAAWRDASNELARRCDALDRRAHMETFGGCLMGQLCPPSMLVAMSVLEGLFFAQQGMRSISLSYAQQTHGTQDVAALASLRMLAEELLPADVDRHLVLYTYMGVYPSTVAGAELLLSRSAELAVRGGAERLIVKTSVEAQRLPTVHENVVALVTAARVAAAARVESDLPWARDVDAGEVLGEARALVEATLNLSDDVGTALLRAFDLGLLDVPFCLHEDNAGETQGMIDDDGRLRWAQIGRLPLPASTARAARGRVSADGLLRMLRHTANNHDLLAVGATEADRVALPPAQPEAAEPYRIAIVGTGPRGLAVLERLAARLAADPQSGEVEIYAIDAVQVGPGRIWRTNQPHWMLMNTPAGEVTMFSGPPDGGPSRAGAGPALDEWWHAFDPDNAHANAYAPRGVFGQYLRYVLNRIEDSLPDRVRLHRVYAKVDNLSRTADRRYRLTLDSRVRIDADRVLLSTGHALPELTHEQRRLADFAALHHGLRYIRGDSAADMHLTTIAAGSTVGVIGLGLSFYDVLASLTLGRGGRFVDDGEGGLRYLPSGREPRLVASSRSGVPLLARGRNQKDALFRYRPRLFTHERMRAARATGRLDFEDDVLPWLMAEVDIVHNATEVRRRFGPDIAERFAAEAAGAANDSANPREQVASTAFRYGVRELAPVDIQAWAKPFDARRFAGPAEYHAAIGELLRQDLRDAEQGNVDGPVKAALDTIRDVRGVLRTAVDFGGLTPESHRTDFLGWFVPLTSNLTTGPPRYRIQQVLALLECGLLTLVGPKARFDVDSDRGRFSAYSPQVAGSAVALDALIDARIPAPDLRRDRGLLAKLRDKGMLRNYVNVGENGAQFTTGGVQVIGSPFHPVNAHGQADPGICVLGIPTEFTRWFTQVGSGRPGKWGEFVADADAIAGHVLAGAPTVSTLAGLMEEAG